jgi:sugar/nucleoside kinase (ribokinase family)
MTSKEFNFDVALATRVGRDFPNEMRQALLVEKILVGDNQVVDKPTTRFLIATTDNTRRMVLKAKCAPLSVSDIENMSVDCWLVSPVFDEVPFEVLEAIKSNRGSKGFVMLDPQGYMRRADGMGNISLVETVDLNLSQIHAIKVDQQEMRALTGGLAGLEGMRILQKRGVNFVLATIPNEVHLLHQDTHYWAKIKPVDNADSTGTGDILSAAFCCAYMKEKDPLWALCFGAGAVRGALETGEQGLSKVPRFARIEENASYFYNTIGFKKLS